MFVLAALVLGSVSPVTSHSNARADGVPTSSPATLSIDEVISDPDSSTEPGGGSVPAIARKINVLMLNSYHAGYNWSDDIMRGVIDSFRKSPLDIELYIEYLDSKRFSPETLEENYLPLLLKKYQLPGYRPDLVIVSDDNAYQFALATAEQWLSDIPVVFCGVNEFDQKQLRGRPNFSGFVQMVDVPRVLHLLERLHPDAQRVAIITDNTPTGEGYRNNFVRQFPVDSKFKPIWLSGNRLSTSQLIARLKTLSSQTVAIITVWRRDAEGRYYPAKESVNMLSRECPVPMYGVLKMNVGDGIVGGYVQDGYMVGTEAAEMAIGILSGVDSYLGLVMPRNECSYIFDYDQLVRHDISAANLPKGSEIINVPETFYAKYKFTIFRWVTVAAVIETLLLAGLYIMFLKGRRAERALAVNEKHYRLLIESSPIGIWQVRDGKLISANKTLVEMFGYLSEEPLRAAYNGPDRVLFVDPSDLDRLVFLSERYDGIRDSRIRFRKAGGEIFWGGVYSVPIEGAVGIDYDGCLVDVDQQEQFIRKLTQITMLRKQIVLPGTVAEKLRQYSDAAVEMLDFEMCHIWGIRPCDQLTMPCTYKELGTIEKDTDENGTCLSNQCLHLQAGSGSCADAIDAYTRIPIGKCRLGRLIASQRDSILIHNVAESPEFKDDWIRDLGIKSYIAVKMRDFSGKPIGAIDAFSKRHLSRIDEIIFAYLAELARDLLINEGIKDVLIEEYKTAEKISIDKSAFFAHLNGVLRSLLSKMLVLTRGCVEAESGEVKSGEAEPAKTGAARAAEIQSLGKKAHGLVDNVRRYLRLEARLYDIRNEPTDLRDLLKEVEAEFQAREIGEDIRLVLEAEDSVPSVLLLDRNAIGRILRGTVNKTLAGFTSGTIRVETQCRPCADDSYDGEQALENEESDDFGEKQNYVELRIVVSATGTGHDICRAIKEIGFDPFSLKLDGNKPLETAVGDYDETCLDLPIVKRIVDLFGGTVTIECNTGIECRFVVVIPKVELPENTELPDMIKQLDTIERPPITKSKDIPVDDYNLLFDMRFANLKVLVAEDGPENRCALETILQKLCVMPIIVTNGQEALDRLKTAPPDLIFMDLQMPVVSGIDAARKIRENPATADILIIATFAGSLDQQLQEEIADLFDSHVDKPFQAEQIADQLTRCVSIR